MLMWNHDCGAIPIVDGDGSPIGIITDRDIAMASALQHKALWQIKAQEVSNGKEVVTCDSGADVESAMKRMGEHGVRRLLVVDGDGRIQGLLSMDDAVCSAGLGGAGKAGGKSREEALDYEDVLSALQQVCRQQRLH